MLDFYQALEQLLQHHQTELATEVVAIEQADSRILADAVLVQYDAPLFDNSAMDGYAIAGADIAQWQIVQRIAAGDSAQGIELKHGQASRIFTGAPIPVGTTAVLQQENVQVENDQLISLRSDIKIGNHIRFKGEELQKGKPLLKANSLLTPAAISLLASQGIARVVCYTKLKVTLFSSGNELVNPGAQLQDGQIFDSNRYLLLAWLKRLGCEVTDAGILPDNKVATIDALNHASQQADVIICSGGVSVGEEDHIKDAVQQLGKLTQWKVAIKPGKPFAWGKIGKTKLFMLPGNPASAFVTFKLLAVPALKRLSGFTIEQAKPLTLMAKADFSNNKTESRRVFSRAKLYQQQDQLIVSVLPMQGSAMFSACVKANALVEIPPNSAVELGQNLVVFPIEQNIL